MKSSLEENALKSELQGVEEVASSEVTAEVSTLIVDSLQEGEVLVTPKARTSMINAKLAFTKQPELFPNILQTTEVNKKAISELQQTENKIMSDNLQSTDYSEIKNASKIKTLETVQPTVPNQVMQNDSNIENSSDVSQTAPSVVPKTLLDDKTTKNINCENTCDKVDLPNLKSVVFEEIAQTDPQIVMKTKIGQPDAPTEIFQAAFNFENDGTTTNAETFETESLVVPETLLDKQTTAENVKKKNLSNKSNLTAPLVQLNKAQLIPEGTVALASNVEKIVELASEPIQDSNADADESTDVIEHALTTKTEVAKNVAYLLDSVKNNAKSKLSEIVTNAENIERVKAFVNSSSEVEIKPAQNIMPDTPTEVVPILPSDFVDPMQIENLTSTEIPNNAKKTQITEIVNDNEKLVIKQDNCTAIQEIKHNTITNDISPDSVKSIPTPLINAVEKSETVVSTVLSNKEIKPVTLESIKFNDDTKARDAVNSIKNDTKTKPNAYKESQLETVTPHTIEKIKNDFSDNNWTKKFAESVAGQQLKLFIHGKLEQCGWMTTIKLKCKDYIAEKGVQNASVTEFVNSVLPLAKSLVPEDIKEEILNKIECVVNDPNLQI